MKKKMTALLAAALFIGGVAGYAVSSGPEFKGKVTAINGNTLTIEVDGGAAGVAVGDAVKIELEEKKQAPKKGKDMLMGC